MKLYELYIILSPNLKEEEVGNLSSQISGELSKEGFGISSTQVKPNERLTYKIKRFRQCHVLDIEISSPEDKTFPEDLDKSLLHNESVLRHFVYSKSEKDIGKAKPFPNFDQIKKSRPERKSSPSASETMPITEQKEIQKIDIEEVDKKLEELLK